MVKILLVVFIILLLALGILLFKTIKEPFLIVSQQNLPALQKLMKITAWLLLACGLIGAIILVVAPLSWNLVTLVAGSLIVGIFAIGVAQLS